MKKALIVNLAIRKSNVEAHLGKEGAVSARIAKGRTAANAYIAKIWSNLAEKDT